MCARFALGLLLALVSSGAAACTTGECYDCGPCGIAGGPNTQDGLGGYGVGAAPDGSAAVSVGLVRAGECGASPAVLLRFDGEGIAVQAVAAPVSLDYGAAYLVSSGTSSVYDVGGTSVVVTRMGPYPNQSLGVSMRRGAVSADVTCSYLVGGSIDCS